MCPHNRQSKLDNYLSTVPVFVIACQKNGVVRLPSQFLFRELVSGNPICEKNLDYTLKDTIQGMGE